MWDTLVWVGACVLALRFRENMWLWVSWVFASVHEVEHVYLFCIYKLHERFWAHGGISGILGKGGLIGSPLARPYLHFGYNFLVVAPMLVGLWDQARWVYDAISALGQLLRDPRSRVRYRAVEALRDLPEIVARLQSGLRKLASNDENRDVRRIAQGALTRVADTT